MLNRARKIANKVKSVKEVHIVTHIDADGITAGAIALKTLSRYGLDYSIEFIKQIDDDVVKKLTKENHELIWFTDLGSCIADDADLLNKIITDHHFCDKKANFDYHLNPHLFGLDGAYELSGAGATYLVSKSIDPKNIDLSSLVVVGACGDLQDRKNYKLIGKNSEIVADGIKGGVIEKKIDIRYFGRETRPVYKLLQYANDPFIPGLSGRESACMSFMQDLGIKLKDNEKWRSWIHLCKNERRTITSNIVELLLLKGFSYRMVRSIFGEIYILKNEEEGTALREAKEFATLLNSTARYGQCDVGLNVCLGDRDEWLKKARNLLSGHRQNLVEGLQFAKDEGITKRKYLQFYHAGTAIRDTILGIITNMLLNWEYTDKNLPLIGFAEKNDGVIKVSARANQVLIDRGLDLSVAIGKSAKHFDGIGGGHNIAAGATIPKGTEEEFLIILEDVIKKQFLNN